MSNPTNFVEWFQSLPIPWLSSGFWGQTEGRAWPASIDDQIALLRSARDVAFADRAPLDALAHLGGDRLIIQGVAETNDSFKTRIKKIWDQWQRAGQWRGLLEQLFYYGFDPQNTFIVQQNGLMYDFSGTPVAGHDPTSLVQIIQAAPLTSPLTGNPPANHVIPAGTPWYAFDTNVDLTNRFAVLAITWAFSTLGTATFNNSDTAVVTWVIPFDDALYNVQIGPATDGIILSSGSETTTDTTITASAPWTGTVQVIGYQTGISPMNYWSSSSFSDVKKIIKTFRPNALCVTVTGLRGNAELWDFDPAMTWDGDSNVWDRTGQVIVVEGQF